MRGAEIGGHVGHRRPPREPGVGPLAGRRKVDRRLLPVATGLTLDCVSDSGELRADRYPVGPCDAFDGALSARVYTLIASSDLAMEADFRGREASPCEGICLVQTPPCLLISSARSDLWRRRPYGPLGSPNLVLTCAHAAPAKY